MPSKWTWASRRVATFFEDGDDAGPRPSRASKARRRRARRLYDEDVDYSLKPQTNDALRRELLYYVTSGIRQAARASANSRAPGGRQGRKRERNSQLQRLRSRPFSTRFG